MTAKKKKIVKDKVLAAVQFIRSPEGKLNVHVNIAKGCPEQTAALAHTASKLLFQEGQRQGAVAVDLDGVLTLVQPANVPPPPQLSPGLTALGSIVRGAW